MASSFARWSIGMGVDPGPSSITRSEGSGGRIPREEARRTIVIAMGMKRMMKTSRSFGTWTTLKRRLRKAITMSYVSLGFSVVCGCTGRKRLIITGLYLS
jgi:hypothetical protein